MIVQTAEPGRPHFVLTMAQHTDFCGQLAAAFGNDQFEVADPRSELIYVVANHDRGWDEYDAAPGLDPETRLPYSLVRTPPMASLVTNYGSPEFNERHSPYCGLLSSMHSWGLHNKRYGYSKYVVKNRSTTSIETPPQFAAEKEKMLAREVARQERLRQTLRADGATAPWVEDAHLFQNYKQLQFFDTLSLYFHLDHEEARGVETYVHVPRSSHDDSDVTVRRAGDATYALSPFPFKESGMTFTCMGKYMDALPEGSTQAEMLTVLGNAPIVAQTYTFVA